MQSWSDDGQNGADETQHQWQNNYSFPGQNGQFDPHQSWAQPIADQNAYSHINPQDDSTSNFFDSAASGNSFLSGALHGSQPNQTSFHADHDSLSLGQQYSQSGQDVLDPAFSDIPSDIYGQHGKMNLDDPITSVGQLGNHTHASAFAYSFAPSTENSFDSPIQQYSQPAVLPQQNRQDSHTPVQQFEGIPSPFPHGHTYNRSTQQSPVQNQPYGQSPAYSPPVHGQIPQTSNIQTNYQQPQQHQAPPQQPIQPAHQPQQQTQAYNQAQFVAKERLTYSQTPPPVTAQNFQQPGHQQQIQFTNGSSPPPATNHHYLMAQPAVDATAVHSVVAEPPAKKRKRTTAKSAHETPTPTPEPTISHVDSPMGSPIVKKVDDIDSLLAPTPSTEEAQLIAQFNKRTKAAQAKHPAHKGLPYLIYDGTVKLPAPKSYDKLAPLVALPARNGKPIIPELGYSLPCEVQGRFTNQYRPSPDKGGLDERRVEANHLLDEFDRQMKDLGKRRPKYTEYPHAFKEQLKSDEATKNKAEKKAKKELEEEKTKPVS